MEQNNNNSFNLNEKPEFGNIMFDVVDLPSGGVLYQDGKAQVTVEGMCAKDEAILLSPNLIKSNKAFDTLISLKVKDLGMSPEQLLPGDYDAILFNLRVTAYGPDYETIVTSPFTGEDFKETINLAKFEPRGFGDVHDKDGHFSYITKNGNTFIYRYLNMGEMRRLRMTSESREKMLGGANSLVMDKLKAQIISINGNTDKAKNELFLDRMQIREAKELRNKINEVEAGLDLTYEFTCPGTGQIFQARVSIGSDFFYPI
jgi:hypothetical protein